MSLKTDDPEQILNKVTQPRDSYIISRGFFRAVDKGEPNLRKRHLMFRHILDMSVLFKVLNNVSSG